MTVYAFHPDLSRSENSDQGQDMVPIFWGGPDGNVPDSPVCGVKILMAPGKVSRPHVHREVQVQVTLESACTGVWTLAGDRLETASELRPGGTLVIPPGVPHIALYPHAMHMDGQCAEAMATEIRNHPDYRYDTYGRPDLWPLAYERATMLGIAHQLNWPVGLVPAAG